MSAAEGFEEFVAIVEAGSVTAAADQLGVPRPTMSRRLARLEERLEVRLLHRTTRRLAMTPQGERLYATARRVVLEAQQAEAEVRRLDGVPRGLLRLTTPNGIPEGVFAQWLVDFMRLYPEVSMEIVTSSNYLDIVAEGFDIALRGGPIDDASLVTRTLVRNRLLAAASPAYLDRHGRPERPEQLSDHNCLIGYRGDGVPELRWPLYSGGWTTVAGTLTTNHMALRIEAAKRHLGIALVVDRVVTEELRTGELEQVLAGVVGREERASLVYPDRNFVDPKVRAFIDFMVERVVVARRGSQASD